MLFGKKERHAESLMKRHIELVGEVISILNDTVRDYCADSEDFKEKAALVRIREHDADEVRREIEMTLYEGAFMPIERGDYVALVEQTDKIANQCESVADYLSLTRPELCGDTAKGLTDIVEATMRAYTQMPAMFDGFEDGRAVLAMAHEVEEEERAVDQIYARVVSDLFEADCPLSRKLHVKMLLDRAASISNRIEDASDRFCVIVAKRP